MKKLLLIIFALLSVIGMNATEASVDFSKKGYANQEAVTSVDVDANVTITFDKGTNNNAPKYYTTGTAVRCYGSNTITITTKSGSITGIKLTFASGDGTNEITADCGSFKTDTWEGTSESVCFTIGGTTGHRRIQAIEVTYGTGGGTTVAKPTISGETSFTESTTVTLTAGEGCKIYWSYDEGDFADLEDCTEYTAPFTLTETATIYAQAVDAANNTSDIANKTFTKLSAYTNIADMKADITATAADCMISMNNWIVNATTSNNVYIQDANGNYGLIYASNHGFKVGDHLSGTVSCKFQLYRNAVELTNLTATTTGLTVEAGVAGSPVEVELSDLNIENDACRLVTVKNVQITTTSYTANTTKIKKGETEVLLYNTFSALNGLTFDTEKEYNITGIIPAYTALEIAPRTADEVELISSLLKDNITWSVEASETKETTTLPYTFSVAKATAESGHTVKYSSSDVNIATISEAADVINITFIKHGVVTFTAYTEESATHLAAQATYKVTVSEPMGGLETFHNGGFEDWATESQPTDWKSVSTASSATLSQSEDAHSGDYSVKIAGATANKRLAYKEVKLAAGWYTFEVYVKAANEGEKCKAAAGYVPLTDNGDGTYTAGTYVYAAKYVEPSNGEWIKSVLTFQLEEETILCPVVMNNKTPGKDLLVDDANLREATEDEIKAVGVNSLDATAVVKADGKYIENGKIVIVKSGKAYSINGVVL